MLKLWAERDQRYTTRRTLSLEEEESVRAYRRTEVERLVEKSTDRAKLLQVIRSWDAPEPWSRAR